MVILPGSDGQTLYHSHLYFAPTYSLLQTGESPHRIDRFEPNIVSPGESLVATPGLTRWVLVFRYDADLMAKAIGDVIYTVAEIQRA